MWSWRRACSPSQLSLFLFLPIEEDKTNPRPKEKEEGQHVRVRRRRKVHSGNMELKAYLLNERLLMEGHRKSLPSLCCCASQSLGQRRKVKIVLFLLLLPYTTHSTGRMEGRKEGKSRPSKPEKPSRMEVISGKQSSVQQPTNRRRRLGGHHDIMRKDTS